MKSVYFLVALTFLSLSIPATFHGAAAEGNYNTEYGSGSSSNNYWTTTSSISGYSNGTSSLAFSYQFNMEYAPYDDLAQNALLVNPPGQSGYSVFDLEVWSPSSSCSSSNPYDYHFDIGYTSDFYSSGYYFYQYYLNDSNGYVYEIDIELVQTSNNNIIDQWYIDVPSACEFVPDYFQLVMVGYGTLSSGGQNHVQDFCMTGGDGSIHYDDTSSWTGYAVNLSSENSNVVYSQQSTYYATYTYGSLLSNC